MTLWQRAKQIVEIINWDLQIEGGGPKKEN